MQVEGSADQQTRFEWAFPLRGRWRSYWFRAAANVLAVMALLFSLTAAEALSHLVSAQNLRVERNPRWRLAETIGNFDRTGAPFSLELGPMRLNYRYPARGRRNGWEPLVGLALQVLVILAPFFAARKLMGSGFVRWAWGFGGALVVLLFPVAVACGPMGCSNIQVWHCVWWWLIGTG